MTYSQALEETEYDEGTLRNAKWVAETIELSRRHDKLSFSIHQEVAGLPKKLQDKLLTEAEEGGLNKREVRARVRELKGGSTRHTPLPPAGQFAVILADPHRPRTRDEMRVAIHELAARLGNVEALEREIDKKLDDQEDAVTWWRATVRGRGGDQKSDGRQIKVAESATLFVEEAERIIGFDKQTISKWAKKLSARDEYREAISRAASNASQQ